MDRDPYSTPESKITATATVEGAQRPVRGIVLALLFDFGGTTVAAAIMTVLGGMFFASLGYTAEEVTSIVLSTDLLSKWSLFLMCIGFGFSYFSGKICVQISRARNLLYPAILAAVGTLIGLVMYPPSYDVGTEIALWVLSAGAVLLGASHELKSRNS